MEKRRKGSEHGSETSHIKALNANIKGKRSGLPFIFNL